MIRDTVTGATKLYRYDSSEKKYRLFSEVSTEAAQFVRVQQQLPDEVAYERLFIFDPDQRPSAGSDARTRSGAPMQSPGEESAPVVQQRYMSGIMPRADSHFGMFRGEAPLQGGPDHSLGGFGTAMNFNNALVQSELEAPDPVPEPELTEAEKRAQLQALKTDLAATIRAEKAQEEIDSLQGKRSELTRVAQKLTSLRTDAKRVEAELNPAFADLPEGISERIRTFEARERRFQGEQYKLIEEQDRLIEEAEQGVPLWADRYFLVGLIGAIGCLAAAVLTQSMGLALANLPFALVAVGAAFRWVSDLEERYKLQVKAQTLQKQRDRMVRNHELDTAATRKLMKVLGTSDPSDLIVQVEADEALKKDLAGYQQAIEALLKDNPGIGDTARALRRLDAAIAKLEGELVGASGSPLSVDRLRRRIRDLEEELALAPADLPNDPLMLDSAASGLARAAEDVGQELPEPKPWLEPSMSTLPALSGAAVEGRRESSSATAPSRRRDSSTSGALKRGESLPPMPAPGQDLPKTPDIPTGRRETSVPGVVAHRSTTMDIMPPPRRHSSSVAVGGQPSESAPPAPKRKAPLIIDLSGAKPDDGDDDDDGYQSAYGGGTKGTDDGAKASGRDPEGAWFAVGLGGGGLGGFGGAGAYGGGGGGATGGDRSRDLITAATDLLQIPVEELDNRLGARLGQYLSAFTDKAFQRVEFGPRGEVRVAGKRGDFVAYPDVDERQIDLVDSSIKMALVELVVRQYRIPVLLDDPFTEFPTARRTLVGQMLAYLSSATQVIMATPVTDLHGHDVKLGS